MSDDNSESQILIAKWKHACTMFDITKRTTIIALVTTLDSIANALAQNDQARYYWCPVANVPSD